MRNKKINVCFSGAEKGEYHVGEAYCFLLKKHVTWCQVSMRPSNYVSGIK